MMMQNRSPASFRPAGALLAFRLRLAPLALPALAMVALPIVTVATADARPGGGASFGNRGMRSYSAPAATSIAPRGAMPFSRPSSPYGASAPGYRSGFGGALARGFVGGLIGAGLFGLLTGHGFFGGGLGGLSLIGLVIQIGLLYLLARWVFRRFFATAGAPAGPGGMAFGSQANFGGGNGGTMPLTLQQQDYRAFEALLQQIQTAWSRQDLPGLQRLTTPEMAGNFNAQLSDLARRGQRNVTSDVRLEKGELSEAWSEPSGEYATVAMRYTLVDVTTDTSGRIVQGNPGLRELVTEYWTFIRRPGGPWVLSAIQQAS